VPKVLRVLRVLKVSLRLLDFAVISTDYIIIIVKTNIKRKNCAGRFIFFESFKDSN